MKAAPAAVLALLGLASLAPAQDLDRTKEAPTSEGPLDNDVFVPVDERALTLLTGADESLARARAATSPAEAERQLDLALDAWSLALSSSGPGASTWRESAPTAERRLSEGVHAGVLRRLVALSAPERARWSARFGPAAAQGLEGLHAGYPPAERTARLAELLRRHPVTPAAARAALELCDLALEAGLESQALGWIARAELEAELAGESAVEAALARRRAALGPTAKSKPEVWTRATGAEAVGAFAWSEPGRRASAADPLAERWLRPGGAFLVDGRFAVQSAAEVLLFDPARAPLEPELRLRPDDYLGGYAPEPVLDAPREAPGWPMLPLADEQGLVLVVGRARGNEPNALLALELAPRTAHPGLGLDLGQPPATARLAWAVVGDERVDASQRSEPVPELAELGNFEFQPGPVASADRIVVQARQLDGQVRAWLLAFDRRDGALVWKRLLASGADRVATARFAPSQKRVAGQPPLALEVEGEPRVFVGTHLGLGVLFDSLLGEPLWSFKNRRRGEHESGWNGDRPLLGSGPETVLLWAPMDSDRIYPLKPFPLAGTGDALAGNALEIVLLRPPTPLFDARNLLGGDAEEILVQGSMGKERTVSARRAGRDRVDALDLGQDERFRGLGLVSPERVWVSTNYSLHLFDRTRELYLLDSRDLSPAGPEAPGGDLYASGAHVLVVGSSALWSFRAR